MGHPSGLPRPPNRLTPRGHAGNTHGNRWAGKWLSADETALAGPVENPVARTVLTKGLVFDGTGGWGTPS